MQNCRRWIVITVLIFMSNVPAVTGVDGQFQQTIFLTGAPPPCPWCFFSFGNVLTLELLPKEKEIDRQISGSEAELGNIGFSISILAEMNSAENGGSKSGINDDQQEMVGSLRKFKSNGVTLGKSNTIITVSMPHRATIKNNDSKNQVTTDPKFNLQVEGNKTNEMNSDKNSTSTVTINLSEQPAKLSVHAKTNLKKGRNPSRQYKGKNTITFLYQ